jgi:hypothetical protein
MVAKTGRQHDPVLLVESVVVVAAEVDFEHASSAISILRQPT